MEKEIINKINTWANTKNLDKDLLKELSTLNEEELYDAFYKDLEFGTAGLRGILGVGTNRMNIYTVGKTTKGFLNYLLENFKDAKERGIVISYDCRHYSQEFAKIASSIIAATGTKVYMFSSLRPTPELSFAVRYLKCIGGIMITASHNPPKYNGYKVYDETGCQLIPELAEKVINKVNEVKDLFNIPKLDFEEGKKQGLIKIIDQELDDAFLKQCKTVEVQHLPKEVKDNFKIVFTPLHGCAQVSLPTLLKEEGYKIYPVLEQMVADPDFKTLVSPNPENKTAFEYAERLGRKINADLLLATDPDADRMGIAVLHNNEYIYLTGNQTGTILIDYLAKYKKTKKQPVVLNTIVTSNSGAAICKYHNLKLIQTLTGFKFIGEQMSKLENDKDYEFFFGYEESYGYIIKDFVRDKDSLQSSLLLAEVASFYKSIGKTLVDALNDIYHKIGFFKEDLLNIYMEGEAGAIKIKQIVKSFQEKHLEIFAGRKIKAIEDYDKLIRYEDGKEQKLTLPKSLVIKYIFENGDWFILRPSGTEPKLKVYISVHDKDEDRAEELCLQLKKEISSLVEQF